MIEDNENKNGINQFLELDKELNDLVKNAANQNDTNDFDNKWEKIISLKNNLEKKIIKCFGANFLADIQEKDALGLEKFFNPSIKVSKEDFLKISTVKLPTEMEFGIARVSLNKKQEFVRNLLLHLIFPHLIEKKLGWIDLDHVNLVISYVVSKSGIACNNEFELLSKELIQPKMNYVKNSKVWKFMKNYNYVYACSIQDKKKRYKINFKILNLNLEDYLTLKGV